jgi:hypothetical protein
MLRISFICLRHRNFCHDYLVIAIVRNVMRKTFAAIALMLMGGVAFASKPNVPNPADYTLHVQVVCSFARINAQLPVQRIGVTIDGVPYELTSYDMPFTAILAPGAYPGRLLAEGQKRADYDLFREYELYLPNQKTRTFYLSGAGPGTCPAAGQ